ncbi:hypothetical protein [Sorangium sp. So ce362]|uniref:hypothetical protein n=1 Tax=Sorangium sp. So ce362 TaxID=3133303 RepID=UPI003F61FDFA
MAHSGYGDGLRGLGDGLIGLLVEEGRHRFLVGPIGGYAARERPEGRRADRQRDGIESLVHNQQPPYVAPHRVMT